MRASRFSTLLVFAAGVVVGSIVTHRVRAEDGPRLADAKTRDAVIAVKRAIVAGHQARDRKALDRLYADDYMAIDALGTIRSKDDLLKDLASGPPIVEGKYDLIAVRRFDDLAFANGRGHLVHRNPDGTTRTSDYYSFNVFEKRDGRWVYVSAFLP